MRYRSSLFLSTLLAFLPGGSAIAGPNQDGVLILHAMGYAGRGSPCQYFVPLDNCEDARVNVSSSGSLSNWFVLAAFPNGSTPRVSEVSFGIDYDDSRTRVWMEEPCNSTHRPDADWPSPGTGTVVTMDHVETRGLFQLFAFFGNAIDDQDARFCLTPHPTRGGWFGDDSSPPVQDPIVDYGCLGFGSDPGYLPCPVAEAGACCLPDGSCQVQTEQDCAADGGVWMGSGSDCETDPCSVPTQHQSWGGVKEQFR